MSKEKLLFLTHLQNLPKNVGDFDKIILPKALKSCPKSNKLPNLVTLPMANLMARSDLHKSNAFMQ